MMTSVLFSTGDTHIKQQKDNKKKHKQMKIIHQRWAAAKATFVLSSLKENKLL